MSGFITGYIIKLSHKSRFGAQLNKKIISTICDSNLKFCE